MKIRLYNAHFFSVPFPVWFAWYRFRRYFKINDRKKYELYAQCRPMNPAAFAELKTEARDIEQRINNHPALHKEKDISALAFEVDDDFPTFGTVLSKTTVGLFRFVTAPNSRRTLPHEICHNMRTRRYGHPPNLGDHMIEEGLANLFFDIDLNAVQLSAFVMKDDDGRTYVIKDGDGRAYYNTVIAPHLDAIRENLWKTNKDKDAQDIIYGGGVYPHKLGYQFGLLHAHHWLKTNGETPASTLDVPAQTMLQSFIDGDDPLLTDLGRELIARTRKARPQPNCL